LNDGRKMGLECTPADAAKMRKKKTTVLRYVLKLICVTLHKK